MNSSPIITLCPICRQFNPCWQHTPVTIEKDGREIQYQNLLAFVTQLANNQIELAQKLKDLADTQNAMIRQIQEAVQKLSQES